MQQRHLLAVAAVCLLASAPRSFAFTPVTGQAALDGAVPRQGGEMRMIPEPFHWVNASSGSEVADFAARHGGRWQWQRNAFTGTPHMVLGSGLAWAAAPVASASQAEAEARRFFAENPSLAGVPVEELRFVDARRAGGKWSVFFTQTAGGRTVVGGRAQVVLTDDGRVLAFGSDCWPGVPAEMTPALGAASAADRATAGLAWDGRGDEIVEQELVVLPVANGESFEHRLAWRTLVRIDDPPGLWQTFVDAATGEILWRYNEVRFEVSGEARADVQDFGYCDGEFDLALPDMEVEVVGQGTDVTAPDGSWSVGVAGAGPFTVQAQLRGPWANANLVGYPDASLTESAGDPGFVSLRWYQANSRHDERDAFFHTNRVHDVMKALDPSFTGLDYSMPVAVGNTSATASICPGNAWYDGFGINFCDSSSAYANTGEIGNVVYHEYGHGITHRVYQPMSAPDDLHEGNSDVVACYIQGTPIVGLGFYRDNCSRGIRDLDNSLVYPGDLSGEGHHDGQIIGGFCWEMRERLRDVLGEEAGIDHAWFLWHYSRAMGRPPEQPDQVTWTFIMDDDDGNLANGTPLYPFLCEAAALHGFGCPEVTEGVFIDHTPLTSTADTTSARAVEAVVTSTEGSVVGSSVLLYYRTTAPAAGSFTAVVMTPAGPPDTYTADIPAQPLASEVEYYLTAEDDAGNATTDPLAAPYQVHDYRVSVVFDPCEAASGWTVGAPDDDATGGIWVNADPVGTEVQPEDDHTPGAANVECWVTGNGTPGGPVGEADVDGGKTTLFSPVYNLAGAVGAKLIYYRWYNNRLSLIPSLPDAWVVDVSNNGGADWVNVETLEETARRWEKVEIDLSSYFPALDQFQARFVASDYDVPHPVEAAIDDYEVVATFAATEVPVEPAPSGVPSRLYLASPQPNPFHPRTTIAYGLTGETAVELAVYDVQGKRVRTLVTARQPAGHYAVAWDGRDEAGRRAPAGIYFARLAAGERTEAAKLILAR